MLEVKKETSLCHCSLKEMSYKMILLGALLMISAQAQTASNKFCEVDASEQVVEKCVEDTSRYNIDTCASPEVIFNGFAQKCLCYFSTKMGLCWNQCPTEKVFP
jgi:hypothetical protein